MDPVYYDSLLVELFQTMEKYNTTIQDLQDHLYDCLYYNSEAERQAGLFSPQLNSSSYFGLPLTPHLYVVHPDDEKSAANPETRVAPKKFVIQSVLPQLEALEKAQKEKQEEDDVNESTTTPDETNKMKKTKSTPEDDNKSCINDPEADDDEKKKDATFKRKAVVDKPEESSDEEEDSGSDVDIDALLQDDTDDEKQQQKKKKNNKEKETQKQKVQNLQDLLRIFSVIPSPPLVQAQTEWISLIQDKLPQYYAAKRQLEGVVEKVEAYKMQFKTKL